MKLNAGTIIDDKYEILEALGSGGFGTVLRARQIQFEREVALKILDTSDADESHWKRFQREAAILQDFRTKFIPSIYGYGIWQGRPYMAMEFVRGKTLAAVLQDEHAMPIERAKPIVSDIAHALEYAHANGVVHRDLSPANIILVTNEGKEEARIIDFGLATFSPIDLRNRQKLTEVGFAVGSFQYMSPEQCLAELADERADIYALGCIVFRMLTGRVPYEADNEVLLMRKHVNEATPHVPSQFPAIVQTIIDKAMAKDKMVRYQSATDFLTDWQIVDTKESIPKRVATPTIGFLAAAVLVLAVASAVTFMRAPERPAQPQVPSKPPHVAIQEAVDLGEGLKQMSPSVAAARLAQIVPLLEGALQTDAQTHELSQRDLEVACVQLARMYRKQKRDADAFAVAGKGVAHELARGLSTPLMVRTYAAAAMGLDQKTKDKAIQQLYVIAYHTPPFVLPTTGEARMSLAELLVADDKLDQARKCLPEADKLGIYLLSESRWQLCKARMTTSAREVLQTARQLDREFASLPREEQIDQANDEGILFQRALKIDETTHQLSARERDDALKAVVRLHGFLQEQAQPPH